MDRFWVSSLCEKDLFVVISKTMEESELVGEKVNGLWKINYLHPLALRIFHPDPIRNSPTMPTSLPLKIRLNFDLKS